MVNYLIQVTDTARQQIKKSKAKNKLDVTKIVEHILKIHIAIITGLNLFLYLSMLSLQFV